MTFSKTDRTNIIFENFVRIVKLYVELEKAPRSFGTDEALYSSEIHLIELIGDHEENLGITDLAKLAGVTKGAISQNLKKLENKGLVIKEEDEENVSRLIVKLTSKGKAAFYTHRYWHETMDGGYKKYLMSLGEDKIIFLMEFLSIVENFLKGAMKEND